MRPFGQTLSQSGTHWEPLGYIGERFDEETGLQYLNARYYDAELGSFVSADPLEPFESGVSRYGYASGDPVNFLDPSGLLGGGVGFHNSECGPAHSNDPPVGPTGPPGPGGLVLLPGGGPWSPPIWVSDGPTVVGAGGGDPGGTNPTSDKQDGGDGSGASGASSGYTVDDFIYDAAQISAGFGDNLTFGLTEVLRGDATNSLIDKCSSTYWGGQGAGLVWWTAAGGSLRSAGLAAELGNVTVPNAVYAARLAGLATPEAKLAALGTSAALRHSALNVLNPLRWGTLFNTTVATGPTAGGAGGVAGIALGSASATKAGWGLGCP